MATIVVLVPTEEMAQQARGAAIRLSADAVVLKVTSETVMDAVLEEQKKGALVAVARGHHAKLIMKQSVIPLVEIVMTGQNLAVLFHQAKAFLGKEDPHIALIGFPNMFSQVESLSQVLGVNVRTYLAEGKEEIGDIVKTAKEEGADVIIGGSMAVSCAKEMGIPCLFLHSTPDSVDAALRTAKRVLYAIELEKARTEEIASLMDYSFDGVLRLSAQGQILFANYLAEKIFKQEAKELEGQNIRSLLYMDTPDNPILSALQKGVNVFGCPVRIRLGGGSEGRGEESSILMANLGAINVYGQTQGFILAVQESKRIEEMEEKVRKERGNQENKALHTFADVKTSSPLMQDVKETAMQYARYNHPILLYGESGVGKRMLAECIYHHSLRSDRPFIRVDCGGLSDALQQKMFLGDSALRGVFYEAHTGTLLIENVDQMHEACQYQLLHALENGTVTAREGRTRLAVNIRFLCTTTQNLYAQVQEGSFLNSLYSRLSQFQLTIPSLSERREDLPELVDDFIEKYGTLYRRYISLTKEAKDLLCKWNWFGNVRQLELFCEKLVLISKDKVITEDFMIRHLPQNEGAAKESAGHAPSPIIIVSDSEGAKIMKALKQHGGNRAAASEELGISKTTLWRKMKKYGIDKNFR